MLTLGLGWAGLEIFWAFHAGVLPLFLREFTDSKFNISLVMSLAGVTGCIVPPVIGYLSDHTTSRFGRRGPYIVAGATGVAACLVALSRATTFGLVAVLAGCMYIALRAAETPYISLLPDVTAPEQRSTASGVMHLVGTFGLVGCFLVSSALWERHPDSLFLLLAGCLCSLVLIAVSLIREPVMTHQRPVTSAGPLNYLRGIARESTAMRFFCAQFCWWVGFGTASTFATLFAVEELGVPEGDSLLILAVFAVVAALSMLPVGMLGDRLGRKRLLSLFIALWAGGQLAIGMSRDFEDALLTVGFSAIPFAGATALGLAFMLDLVPQNRTAEFVGFSVISAAAAQIVGPVIGGWLIDSLGYRSIFPGAAAAMLLGLAILQSVRPPINR